MSKKHPTIVVYEMSSKWIVERFSNYDEAMRRYMFLVDNCDTVILARVLRKHVGPLYESIEESNVGETQ